MMQVLPRNSLSSEAMTSLLSPQMSRFRKSSCKVVDSSPKVVWPDARTSLLGMSTVSYLLHGHCCPGHVHAAAAAVLVVLAIPDQLGPHLRERMGIVRAPADGVRHGDGAPGWER